MRRYPAPREIAYSFGPGPVSRAIKALLAVNIVVFIASLLAPSLRVYLGLIPAAVIEQFWLWQPLSYMFVHGGLSHLAFNMLALWMFGTELERLWGTSYFLKYYFATGLGAAAATMLVSILPPGFGYHSVTIGASGAIYGLLLAFGLTYPNRPIYMYFLFPIPAKYFVMILGAISLLFSITETGGGVAHIAHLGGLVVGYVLLTGGRMRPAERIRYWLLRRKTNRMKRRFSLHSGGRTDDHWGGRVH
jgi:membrane associated rhomboid family serine protease